MTDTFTKTVTIKAVDEENRTATGAVLVPDELDHQADFFRPAAVERFHSDDVDTGVMHSAFPDDAAEFERIEVIDSAETIDGEEYPAGTLVGTRRYKDDDLWQLVSDGVLTGFSIGGDVSEAAEHDSLPDDVRIPEGVDHDDDMPVTELVDGEINEVSDVDIPAVPRATYKGQGLGKAILDEVESEEEFVAIMTEERGHSESDAQRLYQYLVDARDKSITRRDVLGKPFSSPEGAQFEDFDDCVQTLLDDDDELSRPEAEQICGAWQAESKTQDSPMTPDTDSDEPDDATKWQILKRIFLGSDDATAAEAPGATKATDEDDDDDDDEDEEMADDKHASESDISDADMTDDTTKSDDPPAWADDLTEKVESIDDRVSKMEADEDAEKALADAPDWAQDLAQKVDDLDDRVETISKQSGHSQQLGKTDEAQETEKSTGGFTLDPRKTGGD